MLVNINVEILELLKLDDLEETEDNKQIIENTVNAYILGGMLKVRWNVESFRIWSNRCKRRGYFKHDGLLPTKNEIARI